MSRKGCRCCGHCCVVCTDIQLTEEEVAGGRYRMQPRNGKGKLNSWSNKILARKEIFSTELGRPVHACFYFDPHGPNECSIYEDRPIVCRMFKCSSRNGPKIHELWQGIKEGKSEALCLEA